MRALFGLLGVAAAVLACEEVTDPLPRDASSSEASTEIPEAGASCSLERPCLPEDAAADGGV